MRVKNKSICAFILFSMFLQLPVSGSEISYKKHKSAIESIRSNYTSDEIPDNPQLVKWAERSAEFVDNKNSVMGLMSKNLKREKVNNIEKLIISGDIIVIDPGMTIKADEIIIKTGGSIAVGADINIKTEGSIVLFEPVSVGIGETLSFDLESNIGGSLQGISGSVMSFSIHNKQSFFGAISLNSSMVISEIYDSANDLRWYLSDRIEKRRALLDEFLEGIDAVDSKEATLRIVAAQE